MKYIVESRLDIDGSEAFAVRKEFPGKGQPISSKDLQLVVAWCSDRDFCETTAAFLNRHLGEEKQED